MRRPSRDALITLVLVGLLGLMTAAAAIQESRRQSAPPLASFSNAPDGARALKLWLEALGYSNQAKLQATFFVPASTRIAFLLEPIIPIEDSEWETLDRWIESGGTLILAGDQAGAASAIQHFNFQARFLPETPAEMRSQTPLLGSPIQPPLAQAKPIRYLFSERGDYLTHLAWRGKPVLVSFQQGNGIVFLSAAAYPFSNAGLKLAGNPELVLNLLARAGQPVQDGQSKILWFDEWHHGLRDQAAQVVGPADWLRKTPSGRALLYTAALVFLALVLRGRYFGRPLRFSQATHRRGALEYITAIANLTRRAGHRSAVLKHYHNQLKRKIGRRFRLDPTLPDEQYVELLAHLNPHLDSAKLQQTLQDLRQAQPTEKELVRAARQASILEEQS